MSLIEINFSTRDIIIFGLPRRVVQIIKLSVEI